MNLFEPLQPSGRLLEEAGHALAPGFMLEDFEITRVLGLTSFGALYLATHVGDRATMALKEYLPSSLATRLPDGQVTPTDPAHDAAFQRGLQAFIGEALALSQFDHPHLLPVTCIWEANGTAYRAMPYLMGHSLLAQRASSQQPASQDQLQALLDALLGALEALHGAGLNHGQIEPVNIFMAAGERPVLMDFDAVHHAISSNIEAPYADAYADPAQARQMAVADLHAVAAVLHFAISGQWATPSATEAIHYERLADVLAQFKDSASVLGYAPEFLSAIDIALAMAPGARPASVAAFRGLFDPKLQAVAVAAAAVTAELPRKAKRPAPPSPPVEYPLSSTESVLALLANFDHQSDPTDDIEHFESPPVPTLTEEAEPTLPPMRTSLFDAVDAGDALPYDGVGYGRSVHYTPMPTIQRSRLRRERLLLIAGVAIVVAVCVGALGWLFMSGSHTF